MFLGKTCRALKFLHPSAEVLASVLSMGLTIYMVYSEMLRSKKSKAKRTFTSANLNDVLLTKAATASKKNKRSRELQANLNLSCHNRLSFYFNQSSNRELQVRYVAPDDESRPGQTHTTIHNSGQRGSLSWSSPLSSWSQHCPQLSSQLPPPQQSQHCPQSSLVLQTTNLQLCPQRS